MGQPFDWTVGVVSPRIWCFTCGVALTSRRQANQMHHDIHGLPISPDSAQAVAACDRVTFGYLKYRAYLPARMSELFAAEGDFGLAYCLKGYFAMLSYKQANVPVAIEAMQTARRLTASATPREQTHVAALDAWIS